ncbi:hypothetical protein QTP88_005660 [Uroleucon formosanum]
MAVIRIGVENSNDEVTQYQMEMSRYFSSNEAVWRIFSFPIHERHFSVVHLAVHLENRQRVYFTAQNAVQRAAQPPSTTLTSLTVSNRPMYDAFNQEVHREKLYDLNTLKELIQTNLPLLNEQQKYVFDTLMKVTNDETGGIYFLDVPDGTGKTFLISLILATIRSQNKITLALASSGIAATLLEGGRTAHSALKLPLNMQSNEIPTCNISKNSAMAKVFQQLIPRSTPADELNACLKSSNLWKHVKVLHLIKNMRVELQNDQSGNIFSKQLFDIGNGKFPIDMLTGCINFPLSFCQLTRSKYELIQKVFLDVARNYRNHDWLSERGILAVKNIDVNELNFKIQEQIIGESTIYKSVDSATNQEDDVVNYPPEFLNSLDLPGLPLHNLQLKVKSGCRSIKFLSSGGLPFHGENEILDSTNNGNFLGCIELLCKFDPFIADHSRFGNKGKGVPSYLSSTTGDGFVLLLADYVKTKIVTEIKLAKYFSIIVDSTPDVSNVDQLTFVVRYVATDGSPNERYLTFIPNCGHTGEDMEKAVVSTLETLDININDCRGQSYDNAYNMSGCYKGLQNRIKELNPLAHYVPCAGHSLQLVGSAAAESSRNSTEFFALEQQLYNFFHSSTKRYGTFYYLITTKTLSKTRWSARADTSKAMYKCYKPITTALIEIGTSTKNSKEDRLEAKQLSEKLKSLEMTLMICFWNEILTKFQDVSKILQGENLDLDQTVNLYEMLQSCLMSLRNEEQFSTFESKAKSMCGSRHYKKDTQRIKKLKLPYGESEKEHTEFNGRKSFITDSYYSTIDTLDCYSTCPMYHYFQ